MAQLKQCSNGHYYDTSMYPSCPYCSGASVGIDRSVADYGIKTTIPTGSVFTDSAAPITGPASATPTVSPDSFINPVDGSHPGGNGETIKPVNPVIDDYESVTEPATPYQRKKTDPQSQDTDSAPQTDDVEKLPQNSVVGWLVAVGGPYIGRSFELHHEYNYIGREAGDIILAKDAQVSRVKNAWVMYSGRNNRFKFGAGESSNIVYINDDELAANSSVILKPYDQIEIGTSKFRFVPFCCDQFHW